MNKTQKAIIKLFFSVLICALSMEAYAVKLGELKLFSGMDEPLRADIGIDLQGSDIRQVTVDLANPEAFANAGIDREFVFTSMNFALKNTAQGPVVRITSDQPIDKSFLVFLIEAKSSLDGSTDVREYTALFDLGTAAQQNAGIQLKEGDGSFGSSEQYIADSKPVADKPQLDIPPTAQPAAANTQNPAVPVAQRPAATPPVTNKVTPKPPVKKQPAKSQRPWWFWLLPLFILLFLLALLLWLGRWLKNRSRPAAPTMNLGDADNYGYDDIVGSARVVKSGEDRDIEVGIAPAVSSFSSSAAPATSGNQPLTNESLAAIINANESNWHDSQYANSDDLDMHTGLQTFEETPVDTSQADIKVNIPNVELPQVTTPDMSIELGEVADELTLDSFGSLEANVDASIDLPQESLLSSKTEEIELELQSLSEQDAALDIDLNVSDELNLDLHAPKVATPNIETDIEANIGIQDLAAPVNHLTEELSLETSADEAMISDLSMPNTQLEIESTVDMSAETAPSVEMPLALEDTVDSVEVEEIVEVQIPEVPQTPELSETVKPLGSVEVAMPELEMKNVEQKLEPAIELQVEEPAQPIEELAVEPVIEMIAEKEEPVPEIVINEPKEALALVEEVAIEAPSIEVEPTIEIEQTPVLNTEAAVEPVLTKEAVAESRQGTPVNRFKRSNDMDFEFDGFEAENAIGGSVWKKASMASTSASIFSRRKANLAFDVDAEQAQAQNFSQDQTVVDSGGNWEKKPDSKASPVSELVTEEYKPDVLKESVLVVPDSEKSYESLEKMESVARKLVGSSDEEAETAEVVQVSVKEQAVPTAQIAEAGSETKPISADTKIKSVEELKGQADVGVAQSVVDDELFQLDPAEFEVPTVEVETSSKSASNATHSLSQQASDLKLETEPAQSSMVETDANDVVELSLDELTLDVEEVATVEVTESSIQPSATVSEPLVQVETKPELMEAAIEVETVSAPAAEGPFTTTASNEQGDMKIDLARMYLNLGDVDSAKNMLDEVLQSGNAEQKNTAQKLLLQL